LESSWKITAKKTVWC